MVDILDGLRDAPGRIRSGTDGREGELVFHQSQSRRRPQMAGPTQDHTFFVDVGVRLMQVPPFRGQSWRCNIPLSPSRDTPLGHRSSLLTFVFSVEGFCHSSVPSARCFQVCLFKGAAYRCSLCPTPILFLILFVRGCAKFPRYAAVAAPPPAPPQQIGRARLCVPEGRRSRAAS